MVKRVRSVQFKDEPAAQPEPDELVRVESSSFGARASLSANKAMAALQAAQGLAEPELDQGVTFKARQSVAAATEAYQAALAAPLPASRMPASHQSELPRGTVVPALVSDSRPDLLGGDSPQAPQHGGKSFCVKAAPESPRPAQGPPPAPAQSAAGGYSVVDLTRVNTPDAVPVTQTNVTVSLARSSVYTSSVQSRPSYVVPVPRRTTVTVNAGQPDAFGIEAVEAQPKARKTVRIGDALLHEVANMTQPEPYDQAPVTQASQLQSRTSVYSRGRTSTVGSCVSEVFDVYGQVGPGTQAPGTQAPQSTASTFGQKAKGRKSIVPIASQVLTPAYSGQLRVFDDYDFGEEKGAGAFGKVMRVSHKRTGLQRACKALSIRSPRQFELIETEVALMRKLDHPNILRIFESYYDGDRNIYLIIELCSGGDMQKRIKDASPGAMPEVQVAWALYDTLTALRYCHVKGIIHRDIKPDNLLYTFKDADSPLKVIDFGLSDFLVKIERRATVTANSKNKSAARIGTPHYMAAEVYLEGIYDERVDIFACGVVMAEALTGVHPFFTLGKDNLETIRGKILKGKVDFHAPHWQQVPGPAKDLAKMMLHPDRRHRLDAAGALAHPWILRGRSLQSNHEQLQRKVFQCLGRFRNYNVLKQAAFRVLAKQLDDTQLAALQRQFQLLDTDGDGTISVQELLQGAQKCGCQLSHQEAVAIVETFGKDPTNCTQGASVGYSEFLSSLLEVGITLHQPQLWDVFQRFSDGGQSITQQSLLMSLTSMVVQPTDGVPMSMTGEEVMDHELRQVFVELGGHDGCIDFRSFCSMWQG